MQKLTKFGACETGTDSAQKAAANYADIGAPFTRDVQILRTHCAQAEVFNRMLLVLSITLQHGEEG